MPKKTTPTSLSTKAAIAVSILVSSWISLPAWCSNVDQQSVRVRLNQDLSSIEIHGKGLQVQGLMKAVQPVAIPSEETIHIQRFLKNGHWVWQVENKTSKQASLRWIAAPFLSVAGQGLRSEGRSLPNHLLFSGQRTFNLIAEVHLKDYLLGVLAKEMPVSWPLEALKAQAIAARSYTLAVMHERRRRSFQLESSILDQVYEKFEAGVSGDGKMDKVIQAVNETEGVVLLAKSSKSILKAYYHADCGGKTSSSMSAFGTKGLKGGVVDTSCPANPNARWSLRIPRDELAQALKTYFSTPADLLSVRSMQAKNSAQDQRVDELSVQMQDGEKHVIKAHELRSLLGFQNLRSTHFQVLQKNNDFIFKGVGFGHGVGLCQWGSKALAQNGTAYEDILQHYYPEAELQYPQESTQKQNLSLEQGPTF